MPGEVWKDIPGWEGYYQASSLGRVKSISHISFSGKRLKTRILRQTLANKGYLRVRLYKNGIPVPYHVARVVLMSFYPNTDNKPTVDHINAIKTDNSITNLKWATHKENQANPNLRKLRKERFAGKTFFEVSGCPPRYGLDNNKAHSIVGINPDTKEVRYYTLLGDCAADGFTPSNVSKVCRKIIKHSGGWEFYYTDDPELKSHLPKQSEHPLPSSPQETE